VVVDAAEWPEEIDRDRAQAAKEQAEKQLDAAAFKFETDNARDAYKRAVTRLKVCGAAKTGG
jgi:F-type H+-transporting ATPase subunit epsilon